MTDGLHTPHPASTCDAFPLAVALSQAKREIERLQAELAEAVAKEREACARIMDDRAAMYRAKAAKRDPFAEDSLTEHERFISNAEASEYGSAAIRERTD